MSEKKPIKIDVSDIKFLILGIVLLIVPILIIFYVSSGSKRGGAINSAKSRLGMNKKAFSFTRVQKASYGQKPKNVAGGSFSSSGSSGRRGPSKPDDEWKAAVDRIMKAKAYIPPQVQALPKEQRWYYEAEMNKDIRMANVYLAQGNLAQAKKLCKELLKSEPDNVVLRLMASGNLCEIYEREGDTNSLRKEFYRYLDLITKLKIDGFKVDNLKVGIMSISKLALKGKQMTSDPRISANIASSLKQSNLSGKISESEAVDNSLKLFRSFPAVEE